MLTIYKASAGSGKTFTLAYEFIKALLGVKEPGADKYHLNSDKYTPGGHRQADRHRSIMALTFTNAATEEMKTRILRELAALAKEQQEPSLYATWLTAEFGCTAEELRESAGRTLAEVLYDYGNFNVSTIDSFFQSVLRAFSREVDHQGDYELSLDTHLTVRQSISLMLDELNYDRPANADRLYSWIHTYAFDKMTSGKGYNFFHRDGAILNSLTREVSDSLTEAFSRNSVSLREYLADPARLNAFDAELKQRAAAALAPAVKAAQHFEQLAREGGFPHTLFNKTIISRLENVLAGKAPGDVSGDTIRKAASGEKAPASLAVAKNLKEAKISKDAVLPCCEALATFCSCVLEGDRESRFYSALSDSLGFLDFFGMALAKLEEYLRDTNTVLISDTGELLMRIISDAETPFIYERLGMKLTNILIDEFQDTSRLQWHNLRPLVRNCIAEGHDNLIIGDEKQAIYRFRDSDSELLGHEVQYNDFPRDSVIRGFKAADNTNHRSAGGVVRFNNTLFARLAANLGASSYGNVVQTPSDKYKDVPAYVRLQFFTDKSPAPETEELLERMAQDILRQHASGYAWADILILTRYVREATSVVEFLTKRHPEIKVLSSEALLLSNSAAVRTIISMLKLIERSYSGRKEADGNRHVYASKSDIEMMITRFNYFRAEDYTTEDALRLALDTDRGETSGLDKEIMEIRAENPANLVALIEAVIAHKIAPSRRKSEYAYIAALQDLAVKHTESPDPSLAAFLKAYDANSDKWAIKASAQIDAVEIMTIHKSKGLERDCVHIPFGDWDLNHRDMSMWLDTSVLTGFDEDIVPPLLKVKVSVSGNGTSKSVLCDSSVSPFAGTINRDILLETFDSLNLAYVAFTRAARELTVYSTTEKLGRAVMDAVMMQADGEELADSSRCDPAAHFDKATYTLTMGEPTKKLNGKDKNLPMVESEAYPVTFRTDTRQLISVDDALATHLDIGGEEDKEIVDGSGRRSPGTRFAAAERGNHLHAILADVRTRADLPRAVERYASRAGLDAATAAEYLELLRNSLEAGGDTVAAWFDGSCRIYAERSIYDAETDSDTDTFRPDRIVVAPDGSTTVVDYKFTFEPRPTHFHQLEHYLSLLSRLGHKVKRGYLWYPLLRKVITIENKTIPMPDKL
ncbi:MAG: UvrD-helicase domain-containing protein [Bacteroidales bacterium]|nr:UvrD-helicase domain-containing protein [Bacteroidales bacterium]